MASCSILCYSESPFGPYKKANRSHTDVTGGTREDVRVPPLSTDCVDMVNVIRANFVKETIERTRKKNSLVSQLARNTDSDDQGECIDSHASIAQTIKLFTSS